MTPAVAVSRRAVLRTGAVVGLAGCVTVAVAPLLAPASAADAPLTAADLRALLGHRVTVSWAGGHGTAVVHSLTGNGGRPVARSSFTLTLEGPDALPVAGELVSLSHSSFGTHTLFAVPERDPRRWVVVVEAGPTGGGR